LEVSFTIRWDGDHNRDGLISFRMAPVWPVSRPRYPGLLRVATEPAAAADRGPRSLVAGVESWRPQSLRLVFGKLNPPFVRLTLLMMACRKSPSHQLFYWKKSSEKRFLGWGQSRWLESAEGTRCGRLFAHPSARMRAATGRLRFRSTVVRPASRMGFCRSPNPIDATCADTRGASIRGPGGQRVGAPPGAVRSRRPRPRWWPSDSCWRRELGFELLAGAGKGRFVLRGQRLRQAQIGFTDAQRIRVIATLCIEET
jgi:hypothetical protein